MFHCAHRTARALSLSAIASALLIQTGTVAATPTGARAAGGAVTPDGTAGAGAPPVARVELDYAAASECPDESAFIAAVRARGSDVERPPAELAGATIVISLQHEGAAFVGSIEVRASGASMRQVRGDDCEQAMQGVALITAATLHETAVPRVAPMAAPPPTPEPEPSTRLERIGQFGVDSVQVGAGALVFDSEMSFSLGAGVELGAVPGLVLPRYELSLTRANYVTTPDGKHYLGGGWLPRMRVALIGTGDYASQGEHAEVALIETSFGGCTALRYDLEGLVLLACGELGLGLGNVDARDASGAAAPAQAVAFGLAGLGLETRYALGPVHIGLKVGATASSRWSAERADGSELFRTSPVAGHALFSVGMQY